MPLIRWILPLCLTLFLPACSNNDPRPLVYQSCTDSSLEGLDCATFTVPKDYDDPGAGTFDLAIVRGRATGTDDERIGTLFFNPGGPGFASLPIARDIVNGMPSEIRRHFDIVLWDPRGVGKSSGLTECVNGSYPLPATGDVDWDAVDAEMRDSQAKANAACEALYPEVVPYISTNATVRDLDQLRAAVGDSKLTYWGTSYGTRIGYVYAHDFPHRVRAMLLTSPVDPNATWKSFAYQSALAPDTALSFFFEMFPDVQERYLRSANTLDAQSLILPSGVEFTRWFFRATLSSMSVSESDYRTMSDFITNVDTALHDTGPARDSALEALDAMATSMSEWPINGGAISFIGCSDYGARPTAQEQKELAASVRAEAPITGWLATQGLYYCQGMTVAPDPVPVDFINRDTPMLIMGSTHDSLTPYEWTTKMASMFLNSRVITYIGWTHTPFLAGSSCVDQYGINYLIHLERPDEDVTCPNTIPPESRIASYVGFALNRGLPMYIFQHVFNTEAGGSHDTQLQKSPSGKTGTSGCR